MLNSNIWKKLTNRGKNNQDLIKNYEKPEILANGIIDAREA